MWLVKSRRIILPFDALVDINIALLFMLESGRWGRVVGVAAGERDGR